MDAYETRAVLKCIAAGSTAEQVEKMGYREIAALAGVTPDGKGASPKEFFYVNVRRAVANDLRFYAQYGFLPSEAEEHPEAVRIVEIDRQIAVLQDEKAVLGVHP